MPGLVAWVKGCNPEKVLSNPCSGFEEREREREGSRFREADTQVSRPNDYLSVS